MDEKNEKFLKRSVRLSSTAGDPFFFLQTTSFEFALMIVVFELRRVAVAATMYAAHINTRSLFFSFSLRLSLPLSCPERKIRLTGKGRKHVSLLFSAALMHAR